jgi:hypothetical protein
MQPVQPGSSMTSAPEFKPNASAAVFNPSVQSSQASLNAPSFMPGQPFNQAPANANQTGMNM